MGVVAPCCGESKKVQKESIKGSNHNILQGIRPLNTKLQIQKIKRKEENPRLFKRSITFTTKIGNFQACTVNSLTCLPI